MSEELDIFGRLVMEKLRDVSIELCEGLVESRFVSPGHKEIQNDIESLSSEQKETLIRCVTYCIDGGINDFLFNLEKESSKAKEIEVSVRGKSIVELTDGLSKALYGEAGWQKRLSKYGS